LFRVLIVDDIETNGEMIDFALKLEGYSVKKAKSATKGFQIAVTDQYHLLIVDRNMPDGDGKAFVMGLKKRKEYVDVPLFLLSDDSEQAILEDASALGAQAWFKKPIDITRLVEEAKKITQKQFIRDESR